MEPSTGGEGPGLVCDGLTQRQRTVAITEELSLITPVNDLLNPDTPTGMAYEYIVFSDPLQLCPGEEPQLSQRFVLSTLYYSTSGDGWLSCFQDDTNCDAGASWLTGDDSECQWAGISCGEVTGEVAEIELGKCRFCNDCPFCDDINVGFLVPLFLTLAFILFRFARS